MLGWVSLFRKTGFENFDMNSSYVIYKALSIISVKLNQK